MQPKGYCFSLIHHWISLLRSHLKGISHKSIKGNYVWWIKVSNYSLSHTPVSNIIASNLVKLCSWEYTIRSDNKLQHDHHHIITWICSSYLLWTTKIQCGAPVWYFLIIWRPFGTGLKGLRNKYFLQYKCEKIGHCNFPSFPLGWGLLCFAFCWGAPLV